MEIDVIQQYKARYITDKTVAIADLSLARNFDEFNSALSRIHKAEAKIEIVDKYFKPQQPQEPEEKAGGTD